MKHKIAILSDVHGNVQALEAVLAAAQAEKATEYWFLGDLLMPGPGTNRLFELLNQVHLTAFLRGNWDNFVAEISQKGPDFVDLSNTQDVYVTNLVQYVWRDLRPEYFRQLMAAPISTTLTRNGLTIALSHNLPQINYGHQLLPYQQQDQFDELLTQAQKKAGKAVDLAIYGHVHHQLLRTSSQDQLVINPGAIGQPYSGWQPLFQEHRAQFALLNIDDLGFAGVDFRRVAYDVDLELANARQAELPYFELYRKVCLTGFSSTHDPVALNACNQETPYVARARAYLQDIAVKRERQGRPDQDQPFSENN
ncbi:metallophosphoesterase family protein [Lapidilactobacillus luobeiensis]|uniref:metallophosphoesterase family protein n=1 Tax=Lapidilactobacillus luobeiensis TaxID=2950371 RepID=UPI0021C2A65F|nr:metallophosphoesterase family protein [Lapidilactobacillus luobeiensis]